MPEIMQEFLPFFIAAGSASIVLLLVLIVALVRRNNKTDKAVVRSALSSTRISLTGISDATTLKERLLEADFGSQGIDALLQWLEQKLPNKDLTDEAKVLAAVRAYYLEQLETTRPLAFEQIETERPVLWLIVGVNGSGKTTTVAKLAKRWIDAGHRPVVGACDTFRAAAAEQLQTWGERVGFRVVTGGERTDPAAVGHNTVSSALAKKEQAIIIDTAGRLHADQNLMRELEKVYRVASKAAGRTPDEVLLVLDANQGQNLRKQIEQFSATVPVTGLIITKYDGTGRGGAAIDALRTCGLPIRAVGIGEKADDLIDPSAEWIVERIFG